MIHIQEWFKLPVPDSAQKINSKWTKGFINVRLLKHLEKWWRYCRWQMYTHVPAHSAHEQSQRGSGPRDCHCLLHGPLQAWDWDVCWSRALPKNWHEQESSPCRRLPSASLPRMQSHKQPCWDPWLGLAGCHLAFPTLSIRVALSLHLSTQPICSQLHLCFEFVFLNLLYLPIRLSDSALWSLTKHFKI